MSVTSDAADPAAKVHQTAAELAIPGVWKARLREQLAKGVPIEEKDRHIFGPHGECGRLSVPLGCVVMAIMAQRWPIVGRQPELAAFERALSVGEQAGLVIHGQAGVGKTRLAEECRQRAAAAGHPTEQVTGSRSTAPVPLGAVAGLLPGGLGGPGPDGQLEAAALFERTRRALHRRHGGRRLVAVADDVSLLDSASLALLGYLAAQATIFLIATVSTGAAVPDLVTGLWRDGRAERVDLEDLSRADLDVLLHLVLGGPVEAGTGREFWQITWGNPLYVRELVLGCLESGALAVLERMDGTDRRTRVVRAIAAAPALAVTGRTADAVKAAEAGYADHLAAGDELALAHPAMHLVNQVFALTEAGRLADAGQLGREGAEIVAARRVPIAQIFFAANLGRVATLQGQLVTARRYYAEAAGLAEAHRFAGPRRLALSGLALAYAMLGGADAAAQALAERDTGPAFGFRQPEQQLADAWTAHASGRPAEAAERFRDAAAHAASTGHRTAEAWLLHDLTRTSGEDTSARLRDLAAACDSPLISARARHAAAAQARNPRELADAAGDFQALGAMLLAAEAAAGAAEAFTRAGDRRAAAAAARRASALAASCEGAATPDYSTPQRRTPSPDANVRS